MTDRSSRSLPPETWKPAARAARALASPIQRILAVEATSGIFHARGIDLIAHHDARALCQLGQVGLQLVVDDAVILNWIATFVTTGEIDNMENDGAALYMAKEGGRNRIVVNPVQLA